MSLVNKMLRDLDARHAGSGERAGLPAAVTPLAARQEPHRVLPWLAAVVVVAMLVLAAWYATRTGNSAVPDALPVAAAPAPAVAPAGPAARAVSAEPAATAKSAASAESGAARQARSGAREHAAKAALPSLRMADRLSAAPALDAAEPQRKPAAEPTAAGVGAARPAVVALPRMPPLPAEARIDKQPHLLSAAERAEIDYRRGILAQRQGNAEEAAASYRAALADDPQHAAARQALAGLLIEGKRFDEAEELLLKGIEMAPVRLASTLALARLKVERNQAPAALELLQKNSASGERSAEYQGFVGALLNRGGRAQEAVERYREATRLAPSEGRWWAGLGIALEAAGQGAEAREAYQRARALPGLPADLAQHVEQRLRQ